MDVLTLGLLLLPVAFILGYKYRAKGVLGTSIVLAHFCLLFFASASQADAFAGIALFVLLVGSSFIVGCAALGAGIRSLETRKDDA